jgi:hypothetical protein
MQANIEVKNVDTPLADARLVEVFSGFRHSVAYQTTQMPIAMCSGSRISRTVKIRLYCSIIDTLMKVRLKLYVMILQKRYCQKLAGVSKHRMSVTNFKHELNMFGERDENCMLAVTRICFY